VLFSFGMDWQDKNNNVLGVVNSKEGIEAAQFYHDLYQKFSAPGLSNAFFNEVNDAYVNGKAAMMMNYFAFLPMMGNSKLDPKFYDKTGYFVNPAGPTGKRFAALGGQGLTILSYIDKDRQKAAFDWLKWFSSDKTQARWAELGGYSCNVKALQSEAFLKSQPYNPAFAQTMTFVKDFWNIPVYGPLLQSSQKYLHRYIVENVGTAKEAMDGMAQEQPKVLVEGGYVKK
jgi:multiple sugar transport system substrate-binding protein